MFFLKASPERIVDTSYSYPFLGNFLYSILISAKIKNNLLFLVSFPLVFYKMVAINISTLPPNK